MTNKEIQEQLIVCKSCEYTLVSQALERQIQKPKFKYWGYRCPSCGEPVDKDQYYCGFCGQALLPYREEEKGNRYAVDHQFRE